MHQYGDGNRESISWPPPLKTDAAPWSLLILSEVTVLGISFSLPGRGSAQHPKKFTGCQIPWSSLIRQRKCQPSCPALNSAAQLCCQPLSLCSLPRDDFPRFSELHVCICWMWEASSLDSLNALSGSLHWLCLQHLQYEPSTSGSDSVV